ncbi:hypothetical protein BpHYR1_018758 [Brachionus plicatilis]|uniref:Uncharacterized protein n=1 Tax=Brachionus plicatilis TaxID=10195 RepID=A0A3M7QVY3_BRAPC|nr:hypothetical protein BpHYR1_018758 [Brachionus plicatilis]
MQKDSWSMKLHSKQKIRQEASIFRIQASLAFTEAVNQSGSFHFEIKDSWSVNQYSRQKIRQVAFIFRRYLKFYSEVKSEKFSCCLKALTNLFWSTPSPINFLLKNLFVTNNVILSHCFTNCIKVVLQAVQYKICKICRKLKRFVEHRIQL